MAYLEYVDMGKNVTHMYKTENNHSIFYGCGNLETIDNLIVNQNQTFSKTFNGCYALKNLTIGGTIGNDIDFSPCKELSKESIESILGALSTTSTGKTVKFSGQAVDSAFETSSDLEDGSDSQEWASLKEIKPNWNIELS